jgi:sugar lactone lactonase YvrE
MLNGSCLLAPGVILLADSFAGLLWRLDLNADGTASAPTVWLAHESMDHRPEGPFPQQPGVNGVRFAAKSGWLYYTSTARGLFMRVAVDRDTGGPIGTPEFVAGGMMGDDFCIDEPAVKTRFTCCTAMRVNPDGAARFSVSLWPPENR